MMETLVGLDEVRVEGRHRQDMGDIDGLAKSIEDVGLINPITVTTDLRLIAGGRRLEAFRRLGREKIPARIVENLTEAAVCLRAERDENTERKEMLPSEKAALGEALYAIEAERAKERQRASGPASVAKREGRDGSGFETGTVNEGHRGETRDIVGPALGMGSRTYGDLRAAYKLANDEAAPESERALAAAALAEMDAGTNIQKVGRNLRRSLRAKRETQETKVAALAEHQPEPDGEWIPQLRDSSQAAALRRRELIREMAPGGYTSAQIGERINMLPGTVRDHARSMGVTINADVALGRNTRKGIDSNRIVGETVTQLEGLEVALNLVDYGDLDPAQIGNWTISLDASITVLKRMNRKLKEMVQ